MYDGTDFHQQHAASRVDAIILQAASHVGTVDGANPRGSQTGRRRPGGRRHLQGSSKLNPSAGVEIAHILSPQRCSSDVRACLEKHGFGRVPPFLHRVHAKLDAEQEYIITRDKPEEVPKSIVRLQSQREKDELLRGLKLQFQRATASYIKELPQSRAKLELEEEIARIKKDITKLGEPYIFVADDG